MRVTETQNYKEFRNTIAYEYISFFESQGYLIILIPNNSKNIEQYFSLKIDLVVLSGGNNVNPKLYNNNELLNDVYNDRDNIEKKILDLSIERRIKVLAICRGFHFINVYLNGSLTHNIKDHVNKKHILESNNNILNYQETNSFHNQAILIDNLSKELKILALAKPNIVEAYIDENKSILGLQWHPERQNKQFDKIIINKFLEGKI
jgi:putative glutamine amidotransferase